ncbi:MAG: N-acetylneuraminate lyase [Candidatus Binatia bacterium]|jgi:N-acetylneuraminate lyase
MPNEKIQGLVAAGFTPMNPDGSVNAPAIDHLAQFLIDSGVSGVFVCGSTGESLSLTTEERKTCLDRWVKACAGRIKVVAHVGHNSLPDARELAAHAQEVGADAISAMPPTFFKPRTLDALVDWCASLGDAAPELPFYYYHIPGMTGVAFKMIDFLKVAEARIPTLAGIKFTFSDLMDYRRCLTHAEGKFDILFGADEIMLAALAMGAKGFIGSTYNLTPSIYLKIIEAFNAGDLDEARRQQSRSIEMVDRLIKLGGLPAFKVAMGLNGVDCGPIRAPFAQLGDDDRAAVKQVWDDLELNKNQ